MLGTDVVVVEEPRFLLGENDNPAGLIGELLEHTTRVRRLVHHRDQTRY